MENDLQKADKKIRKHRMLLCIVILIDKQSLIWDLIASVSEGFLTYSCLLFISLPYLFYDVRAFT